jgi:hypothetical protein
MEADGALQRMMGFAFVEADLGLALQTGVENPVDHEQRPFDTADFPKSKGQFILARIGGQLPQNLAGGDNAGGDRGHDAQDVGPVPLDERLIDFTADQAPHIGWRRTGSEGIEPFCGRSRMRGANL